MGKALDVTMDDEVYNGLLEYLDREFGNTKGKSLVVNQAVREFLQRKGILANPRGKSKKKADQASLFER